MPPVLECRSLTKWFGDACVLDNVDLEVGPGEIHVVLGENGAGKSTLVKIIAGLVEPDFGDVSVDAGLLRPGSIASSQAAGVALIHQEPRLFPDLSVLENVWIDQRTTGLSRPFSFHKREAETRALLDQLGCPISTSAKVAWLSVADQQMVDIAAALRRDLRLLIVDEPTASLTPSEVDNLFTVLKGLKAQGVAVIFIGHRLEEILRISDRITVLRDGRHVATVVTSETNEEELVRLMVGRSIDTDRKRTSSGFGSVALSVSELASPGAFEGITFTLNYGEILGVGGLVGSGRSELLEAIFGVRKKSHGTVIEGSSQVLASTRAAIQAGMALVPEDRGRNGLVLTRSIEENVASSNLPKLSRFGIRRPRRERAAATAVVSTLRVKSSGIGQLVGQLSGGNQQKVSLAKWLAGKPAILLVDEPTRGVDVGSKAEIHALLQRLANEGLAVLVVSSDMRELLLLADRVLVMREGRLEGELVGGQISEENVMRLAAGVAA